MPSADNLAAARWRRLVTARLEERERLSPGGGSLSGAFWDRRADRYAAGMSLTNTEGDPFLRRSRGVTHPASTAIDVGAGTGWFSLPLAAGVGHVTAVDPSAAMLEGLLTTWLLGRRGALRSPLRTQPAAIIHWRPRCVESLVAVPVTELATAGELAAPAGPRLDARPGGDVLGDLLARCSWLAHGWLLKGRRPRYKFKCARSQAVAGDSFAWWTKAPD